MASYLLLADIHTLHSEVEVACGDIDPCGGRAMLGQRGEDLRDFKQADAQGHILHAGES